ncbi:helix-turn-helix transcriptional regulator [Listeria monocytogenes]|uniref:helix-turn-helix domain-containing protein n=1 Tax=Listeria monocytogenes TaxID=1639 RepID=UPI0010D44BB7|nr:helix-turn-helix transcriptional regulator [Listeria monocytogenes]EAC8432157.1 XRE family transcriptional regulator [Listeria monocytogenes]EAE5936043.1 XRE family transcriptional regulator [Listeria monocytogenes]EAF1527912.1 XRE family transcriptional regulator [Listeria monocytogenes]EHK9296189.1 helix-turn-helix transcriptional regulator [Listeria monocytogenes]EIZ2412613.1 helix-turn-helix transcriptional regulator [Listeria monocytogenes]
MLATDHKESISKLIEKKGIKKTFIAKKLDIKPATLSRKLKNPNTFTAIQMDILVDILGVSIDEMDFCTKNF